MMRDRTDPATIEYRSIPAPKPGTYAAPVDLTCETMQEHYDRVMQRMQEENLDALVIYADREHGANFAYLTGFEPRFEEALLVLHRDGKCYLLFGNENLKMAAHSRIKGEVIHVPHFSLPCQPMETDRTLKELIGMAGIGNHMRIGIAGWKFFTGKLEDNRHLFDVPSFMVDAVRANDPDGEVVHAGGIFLDPDKGARIIRNANEVAHYEFQAGLASSRVLAALDAVETGKTEMEIAAILAAGGQPTTVTTICATGDRFTNAVVFPRAKEISRGDRFSISLGLRGGLSFRAAYAAESEQDLEPAQQDYLEKVVIPYYRSVVTWLETMRIGLTGGEMYAAIEDVLPKAEYHWTLNPGHYTDSEEWSTSPFFPGSQAAVRSGMLFQMDIIPSVPGYGGVGAEDGIAVADQQLREELKQRYPETWARIEARRKYVIETLGIQIREEVLPLSDILGYYRPFLLNKACALRAER